MPSFRAFAVSFVCLITTTGLVPFHSGSALAGEDAGEDSSVANRTQLATTVYRQVLERYREGEGPGGVAQIELLARWSQRILILDMRREMGNVSEIVPSALGATWTESSQQACRGHIQRMTALEREVSARFRAGMANAAESMAAKYFRIEAEHVPDDLKQLWTQCQQMAEEREWDVVLPSASEEKPLTVQPKELLVDIGVDGAISVDGKQRTLKELEELISKCAVDNPGHQAVVVRANGKTPLVDAVKVMNMCGKYPVQYSLTLAKE